jgi:hypothetical protein
MPLTKFICPDDKEVFISQCMTQCRMQSRCAPLPYLRACADAREWTGKPSVTQLIRGTRESYLLIKGEYAVRPSNEAFALFGTGVHKALESYPGEDSISEHDTSIELNGITITGTADYVQKEGEFYSLWDYKTSGAFKVKKALGLKSRKEKLMNGETRVITETVPEDVDMDDWVKQLNMYRIMIERENPDISVSHQYIFSIVRDGGLQATRNYGIEDNIYTIPVPIVDDEKILDYFSMKAKALMSFLERDELPPVCTYEECWGGRKCAKYCNVYNLCGGYNG